MVGTGTPASCTETTFNAALALVVNDNQGGTPTFNCGPDPDIILLSSVKNLTGVVTIDGGGKMTLDGQDVTRLFNVNPRPNPQDITDVQLRNITLNRGTSGAQPFGGAILVNAGTRLALDNVAINDSLAATSGGAIATFGSVTLGINNSRFNGNLAANGGAIATRAILNVTGNSFTNNNALGGEGGAIQSYAEKATITASSFVSNGARFGGAIFKAFNELIVENSGFTGNSSADDGGAVYARADAYALVSNTKLSGNTATRDGGGLFARGPILIDRTSFSGNRARAGGAIRMDGGDLTIERASLLNNTAVLEGGAISALVVSEPGLSNPTMDRVTTSSNRTSTGTGGDFALTSSVIDIRARFRNMTLMGASASAGGSTLHLGGTMTLDIEQSLLWAGAGLACVSQIGGAIFSLGGNIGSLGCGLAASSDAISSTF